MDKISDWQEKYDHDLHIQTMYPQDGIEHLKCSYIQQDIQVQLIFGQLDVLHQNYTLFVQSFQDQAKLINYLKFVQLWELLIRYLEEN